jgi:hypothetical protein
LGWDRIYQLVRREPPPLRVMESFDTGNTNQVIEHYNDSKWSIFPGPTFQQGDQPSLESLTAISLSDMWAGGFIMTNGGQALFPLFEHFDGKQVDGAGNTISGRDHLWHLRRRYQRRVAGRQRRRFDNLHRTLGQHNLDRWSRVRAPKREF